MNIELGILKDGGVMLVCDEPLPTLLKRVEFYRDQRLLMLVYNNDNEDSDLMHYEMPESIANSVNKSPDVIIYSLFIDHDPIGYKVPLIKIGDLH